MYPMPAKGASGLPLDSESPGPFALEMVEFGEDRLRLTVPANVASAVGWLVGEATEALMVFDEVGRIDVHAWEAVGGLVIARRRELLDDARAGYKAALDGLLVLEDRYHRVRIGKDRRLTVGMQGVFHLGLEGIKDAPIYVAGIVDRITIMSREYRDQRLRKARSALSDLEQQSD
jgi:hypothetical protein